MPTSKDKTQLLFQHFSGITWIVLAVALMILGLAASPAMTDSKPGSHNGTRTMDDGPCPSPAPSASPGG